MSEKKEYRMTLKDNKTVKQFFDRYYVLPKDKDYTEDERNFLEGKSYDPEAKEVKAGKNGYIVFRKNIKKITEDEELEEIKADTRPVRAIAKDHAVSIATISKIKNNKY